MGVILGLCWGYIGVILGFIGVIQKEKGRLAHGRHEQSCRELRRVSGNVEVQSCSAMSVRYSGVPCISGRLHSLVCRAKSFGGSGSRGLKFRVLGFHGLGLRSLGLKFSARHNPHRRTHTYPHDPYTTIGTVEL